MKVEEPKQESKPVKREKVEKENKNDYGELVEIMKGMKSELNELKEMKKAKRKAKAAEKAKSIPPSAPDPVVTPAKSVTVVERKATPPPGPVKRQRVIARGKFDYSSYFQ